MPNPVSQSERKNARPRKNEAAARSMAIILNLARTGQATTRQEIERSSELGRAIVADRLATLGDVGLIDESELGEASGGRAPRIVRFNKDAGRILLATLDQTALGVGLADLEGNLLIEHHEAFDLTSPVEETDLRIASLFDWLIDKSAEDIPVWAISISVPGSVQTAEDETYCYTTPVMLPAWEGYPFGETMISRFSALFWLSSSVETMTMGEAKAGAGVDVRNMLFIKVGKRIEAGMVFDGRLYHGAQGAAGLIGQLPIGPEGQTASLESLAGSERIAKDGYRAAETRDSDMLASILARSGRITAVDVGQSAQMGDAVSTEIISRSGRIIGQVVATLANMLNPSLIVLSGSVAQTNDILLASVREAVYRSSHPLVTRDLRIVSSQMGNSASLVGAAAVAIERLFEAETLRSWVLYGSPLVSPAFQSALEMARKVSREDDGKSADMDAPAPPVSMKVKDA